MRKFFILLVLLAPGFALAQQVDPGLPDVVNARSLAMGMAYRGTGLGADVVWGNPAMMSAFRRYQADLSGTWDFGNKFAYATVGVVDSQTSRLAAGVGYNLVSLGQGETRRTAHVNTAAFGMPVADWLHVGISARHLLMTGAAEANAITMDAGLVLKIGDALSLGATAHNLIDTNHPELSRFYTASVGFVSGVFALGADARGDFTGATPRFLWSGGGEYVMGRSFPVRAGWSYDSGRGTHFLSFGLGFFTEGGGVDVAYRTELNGPGRSVALTFRTMIIGGQ